MKITLQEAAAIAKQQHIDQKEEWKKYFAADSVTDVDSPPTMTTNEIEKVVEEIWAIGMKVALGGNIRKREISQVITTLTAKHKEEKAAMLQKIYDFGLLDKNERHEEALGWGKEGSDFYKGFIEGAKHVASNVAYQILTIPNCGVVDRPTPDLSKTDVTTD